MLLNCPKHGGFLRCLSDANARGSMMSSSKICVVVVSGSLERLQMAAMVASVAAVCFSMNALPHFLKGRNTKAAHEGEMGDLMAGKVPEFKTLFEQAVEFGEAKLYPCSMAMDVLGVDKDSLESFMQDPTGLTKFLDDARDGQVWTF
jgi:peroxiredoxin family protein